MLDAVIFWRFLSPAALAFKGFDANVHKSPQVGFDRTQSVLDPSTFFQFFSIFSNFFRDSIQHGSVFLIGGQNGSISTSLKMLLPTKWSALLEEGSESRHWRTPKSPPRKLKACALSWTWPPGDPIIGGGPDLKYRAHSPKNAKQSNSPRTP